MNQKFNQIKLKILKVLLAVLMLSSLQIFQSQNTFAADNVAGGVLGLIQPVTGSSFGETVTAATTLETNTASVATFYSTFGQEDTITVMIDTSTLTALSLLTDTVSVTIETTTSTSSFIAGVRTAFNHPTSGASTASSLKLFDDTTTTGVKHFKTYINFSQLLPVETYTVSVRFYRLGVALNDGPTKFTYIRNAPELTGGGAGSISIPITRTNGFFGTARFGNISGTDTFTVSMVIPVNALPADTSTGTLTFTNRTGGSTFAAIGVSLGDSFTHFDEGYPMELTIPKSVFGSSDTVTVGYSEDSGSTWTKINSVASISAIETSTAGTKWGAGYISYTDTITIYSYHLTDFGLKYEQAALTTVLPASLTVGGTGSLSTTGGTGSGSVSYTSSTTSICTVSGTTLTGVSTGTCSIYSKKNGSGDYKDTTSVTVNLTVSAAASSSSGGGVVYNAALEKAAEEKAAAEKLAAEKAAAEKLAAEKAAAEKLAAEKAAADKLAADKAAIGVEIGLPSIGVKVVSPVLSKLGSSQASAPQLKSVVGSTISPTVNGLGKSQTFKATLTLAGKSVNLGNLKTSSKGSLKLPPITTSKSGIYTVKITNSAGKNSYLKIVVANKR